MQLAIALWQAWVCVTQFIDHVWIYMNSWEGQVASSKWSCLPHLHTVAYSCFFHLPIPHQNKELLSATPDTCAEWKVDWRVTNVPIRDTLLQSTSHPTPHMTRHHFAAHQYIISPSLCPILQSVATFSGRSTFSIFLQSSPALETQ